MLDLERLLVVAPHPDDETLGAGGAIMRAGRARVIVVTDGEANPWPQRVADRKWRIGDTDRARWGALRRSEALRALAILGVASDDAQFLGLPDAGLGALARSGDPRFIDAIANEVATFAPTTIIAPSFLDLHIDHRAASYFVHAAAPNANIVTYLVHGKFDASRVAATIELTDEEMRRKRAAMDCHATQLRLSRKRFLEHLKPSETYLRTEHDIVRIVLLEEERRAARQHVRHVLRYTNRRSR
jgi:LmbE family N-acetylglucosaminyl deacetylase